MVRSEPIENGIATVFRPFDCRVDEESCIGFALWKVGKDWIQDRVESLNLRSKPIDFCRKFGLTRRNSPKNFDHDQPSKHF